MDATGRRVTPHPWKRPQCHHITHAQSPSQHSWSSPGRDAGETQWLQGACESDLHQRPSSTAYLLSQAPYEVVTAQTHRVIHIPKSYLQRQSTPEHYNRVWTIWLRRWSFLYKADSKEHFPFQSEWARGKKKKKSKEGKRNKIKLLAPDCRKDKQQSYKKKSRSPGDRPHDLLQYQPRLTQRAMPIHCSYHNYYGAFGGQNFKSKCNLSFATNFAIFLKTVYIYLYTHDTINE